MLFGLLFEKMTVMTLTSCLMNTYFFNKNNLNSLLCAFLLVAGLAACDKPKETETTTEDSVKVENGNTNTATGNGVGTMDTAQTTPKVDTVKTETVNTVPTDTKDGKADGGKKTSPTESQQTAGDKTTKTEGTVVKKTLPKPPKEKQPEIVEKPEQEAKPVGDYPGFYKYVRENLQYPEQALKDQVQGAVRLQFIVLADGSISNIKVMQGIGAGCDEEAVRVLKNSPKWQPAIHQGKAVNTKSMIPIIFKIQQK
jgi:TonB family protein